MTTRSRAPALGAFDPIHRTSRRHCSDIIGFVPSELPESPTDALHMPSWAWWAIGVVIGFVLTFWLGFGMMMELSPNG